MVDRTTHWCTEMLMTDLSQQKTNGLILQTLHATMKEDLHHSPAELVFREDLRLPGQVTSPNMNTSNLSFLPALKAAISSTHPTQTRKSNSRTSYTPPGLHTVTHLFLCTDFHKTLLQEPYTGPHPVICRTDATVTIKVSGKPYITFWKQVKSAVTTTPPHSPTPTHQISPVPAKSPTPPLIFPHNRPPLLPTPQPHHTFTPQPSIPHTTTTQPSSPPSFLPRSRSPSSMPITLTTE
ncbi:hypothetical protein Pmani_011400 [Petrolisthes manimaculis]|uniref:Uncharacterized protein n=1 Tax=Petrolisthes manimaculis TaxID=1843537 RepID=A0AAE1UG73_9EUCA|nr:hypothetical protein Pmani_011400 [Petrolisthes manimaculis]